MERVRAAASAVLLAACVGMAGAGPARASPQPASLPGMRPPPTYERLPLADAGQPRPPALAARGAQVRREVVPDATSATVPRRDCETALHLPWGPIESCRTAMVAGTLATTATLSMLAWWSQGFTSDFSAASEGWFGKGTYAGGIDKLGHAWSFYVATRLGTRALTWARVPPAEALGLAAGLSLGVGLGIEVLDGLSRGGRYGFSWEDMAMNLVGTGFGVLMEARPELDRYLALRLMHSRGGRDGSWYDRQSYLLAFRLSGLAAIGPANPLRYVELVAGYGAKGFRSDLDYSSGDTRRRTAYVGLALNLTELLDRTAFAGDARHGRAHRWTTEALRYLQLPGTVVAARRHWRP
jgi:hypothetical protein